MKSSNVSFSVGSTLGHAGAPLCERLGNSQTYSELLMEEGRLPCLSCLSLNVFSQTLVFLSVFGCQGSNTRLVGEIEHHSGT